MMNVDEIAACSDRLECLIFGMGDYSASQQMQVISVGESGPYPGDVWHYPRYKMTIACRANGIDPVDGPYANFRNPESYRREAERAHALGMVGKWAIHPSQVEIAQQVFSPAADAIASARKQKAAYADAIETGARCNQRRRRDGRRGVDTHRAEPARSRRLVWDVSDDLTPYLTEERLMIQAAAREFTMKRSAAVANELDPVQGEIPMDLRRKMGELGYFGIRTPEESGGLGLGVFEYCLIAEELAPAAG